MRDGERLHRVRLLPRQRLIADPYPYYESLRQQCPVTREKHHGVTMVTGWEEAFDVLNDAETFSSCISATGPFPGFPVPLDGDDVTELIEQHRDELPFSDQLPTLDPPTHTNHRALLMRLITPKRLKENEDAMWSLPTRRSTGSWRRARRVHQGLRGPFTLLVIADLLGVPWRIATSLSEGIREYSRWRRRWHRQGHRWPTSRWNSSTVFSPTTSRTAGANPATMCSLGSRPRPTPTARRPRSKTSPGSPANVFSAGQETTVRLLGAALQTMGERPDIQAQLREDRSLIPNFIEESLRHESPVKGDFRMNRVPVSVGGVDLPAGTTVMVVQAAANRDPRRFDDPATFDPARKNARQHISFGRGIHSCPGAPLARAETRVASSDCSTARTDIRISEQHHGPANDRRYQYVPTYILRGLTELHLEFSRYEVWVDEQRCRGHGVCVTLCPEVFDLTDDGYAEAISSDVPTEFEAATREAIDCCPEQAIAER